MNNFPSFSMLIIDVLVANKICQQINIELFCDNKQTNKKSDVNQVAKFIKVYNELKLSSSSSSYSLSSKADVFEEEGNGMATKHGIGSQ
jgi:hypothetical protein